MKYFALLFALLACGDSTGPIPSAVKLWQLNTVDGAPLPVNIVPATNGGCGVDIRSASFDVRSNGTYTALTETGTLFLGLLYCNATSEERGTYTVSGDRVTFRSSSGHSHSGTLESEGLVRSVEGKRYVFH